MKQRDIALIVAIAFVSGVVSLIISGKIFAPPKQRQQQVEVVDKITSDFLNPDPKYFNNQSLDPTQLIQIGNNNNSNPFNGQH